MRDISFAAGDLRKIDLKSIVRKAMKQTAILGEERVRRNVQAKSYDTGQLLRSIESEVEEMPTKIVGRIFSELDYAINVEEGRKPGSFPNVDALVAWTGRKLKEQGINTRVTVTFNQLKQLAKDASGDQKKAYRQHLAFIYLAGRKIATKGIKAKRIFRSAQRDIEKIFIKELEKEFKAVVQ